MHFSNNNNTTAVRSFVTPTLVRCDDDATAAFNKDAAAEFHNRRVAYKKQVSILRKEYASEVALQRAADQAEAAALEKARLRHRLETRRLKNIAAANASLKQLEIRRQREIAYTEELRVTQVNRDARNERFRKARQMVVNELEAEAPLWLTNHDEVEAAFTKGTEQELWAFPNSVMGAPTPTDDAQFWTLESHTWHMDRTYQTQREALLEELTERAYDDANFDKNYWTEERLQKRRDLTEKAKLRAMVKDAGRRSLLMKQKEMLQDRFPQPDRNSEEVQLPRPMPVPNVNMLAHDEAMEREGVGVLFNNPTEFFEFDDTHEATATDDESEGSAEYAGPTLGVPVGLKNDVILEKTLHQAYPSVLGKMPKPDMRSAKEKKRDERERSMMAAAQSQEDLDLELGGDDMDDIGVDEIDLDAIGADDEWEEGLDPELDKDLLSLPPRERYTEDDIDDVIMKLEKKVEHLEEELDYELDLARQQLQAGMGSSLDSSQFKKPADTDDSEDKYLIETGDNVYDVEALGVNPKDVKDILDSLTDAQLVALHAIDREHDSSLGIDGLREKLAEVPGLKSDQIDAILKLEETLGSNEILAADFDEITSAPVKKDKNE